MDWERPRAAETADQRWARAAVMTVLVAAAVYVLRPFLVPIAWAAILAYATWPFFAVVARGTGGRPGLAATLMTLLILLGVLVPSVLLAVTLAAEIQRTLSGTTLDLGALRETALAWLARVPLVGPSLADQAGAFMADGEQAQRWLLGKLGTWASAVTALAGGLGRVLFEVIVILASLFSFYRHGGAVGRQVETVVRRAGGERLVALLPTLGATVRAVTYGTLLTALVQGTLVMLGCWAAGLPAPVLLGAVAGVLALTPLGPPIVYVPACLWLAYQGRYVAAGLLLAWGVLVVGSVDNLLRSWLLSGAVRIPFLLGLFGLLGGLAAFGPIGLFLGPVAIALVLTLWREWAEPPRPTDPPAA